MTAKREAHAGATAQAQSPEKKAPLDYSALLAARQSLRRLIQNAMDSDHDGLLLDYIEGLSRELQSLSIEIRSFEANALDDWRRASGHHYVTQLEAFESANARWAERQAECEWRRVG